MHFFEAIIYKKEDNNKNKIRVRDHEYIILDEKHGTELDVIRERKSETCLELWSFYEKNFIRENKPRIIDPFITTELDDNIFFKHHSKFLLDFFVYLFK
jgi:hypothetical protein